ncbi:MAG TPA: hypothetical protein VN258_00510 [Mobilitalea sp.]|nr:hypothetical protein [Mobilitalea sp.]
MRALLWKKEKELSTNIIRVIASAILPIIILVSMILQKYSFIEIMVLLPMVTIILLWMALYSIEDIVFAEVVLGTNITFKDFWLFNLLFESMIGLVYSFILGLFTYLLRYHDTSINFNTLLQIVISFVNGFGLIAFATFYISNYSKVRNMISSIGAIFNISIIVVVFATPNIARLLIEYRYLLLLASVLLTITSYLAVTKFSNIEDFIVNIKKMGQAYDNSRSIDE